MKCIGCIVLVAIAASVPSLAAQGEMKGVFIWKRSCDPPTSLSCGNGRDSRTVRVIEDRGTRIKWLIERNDQYPAGPGKMVAASHDGISGASQIESQGIQRNQRNPTAIIHSGDPVVVIEETSVSEARFEGIAVSTASSGEPVKVRLKIGGRTFEALAVAPGCARLLPQLIEANR